MSDHAETNRLGDYLRARRALVTPQQAGLPTGGTRRVTGLRREELSMLAGISADYYLRLERGRDAHPSAQVLDSLARVLLLDDVETNYLHGLVDPGPRQRSRRPSRERVPARLRHLLAAIDVPAFIEGRSFDVLAANAFATALSPRLRAGQNRLRSLMLDPEERSFHANWEAATAGFIGALRESIGGDIGDPRFVELVGELSLASGRFRELWARHDVKALEGGTMTINHPVVGELTLHRDKLPVDGLLLVLYYADADSESAEKLALLASLSEPSNAG